ncbi:MAG: MBL fold metallo-hydrolase [Oscillospiraceae bacterium]
MAKICSLASSSSGNSTYISGGNTAILVDAGISCRGIMQTIKQNELDIDILKGILITHEHIDHIKGLDVLLKKLDIPIYAGKKVLGYIQKNCNLPAGTILIEADKKGFNLGEFFIKPFEIPHDSLQCLGYRIALPDNTEIGYATDLGEFTDGAFNGLKGCHAVVIESNYDEDLLDFGPYPFYIKQRVRSTNGHLSNTDCAAASMTLAKNGTVRFMLAHLSEKNNMPLLAQQTTATKLSAAGMRENCDFTVDVAPKCGGRMLVF